LDRQNDYVENSRNDKQYCKQFWYSSNQFERNT